MRIVLIHATRVAIEPVERAFAFLWPQVQTVSLLDEGLSSDLASGRATRAVLDQRINALADYAMGMAPDAILFTCSSFGSGIEQAAARLPVPVLKPNEAMFDEAIRAGGKVVMLYTFGPAAEGMAREYHNAYGQDLPCIHAPGALEALNAGDAETHDRLLATAVQDIDADTLMLAHFSMAGAAEGLRGLTDARILTSPDAAVRRLQELLKDKTC
ncbi:MAG: aspartate/glutamate racemase family protein [Pseudomonadota bacterium]|nr:aspartate/glutamate racemase family protein [Pseudomonadota bacterium]MEE3069651.1 aspartate/glutamate racemase family protein [Pseudomonadota bacterium]